MLFVLLKKNNIYFLRFCLCMFESDTVNDTVKIDCPMQDLKI